MTERPRKIIEEIATIKHTSVFPVSWLKLKYENEFEYLYVNYTFTRTIHPYGRCLRVNMPEKARNGTIVGYGIKYLTENGTGQ